MKIRYWCGTYRLDENKNSVPCSLEEWGLNREYMRKNNIKHVAEETIHDLWISTVWIGLDQKFPDDGPPLLFETMVFNKNHEEIYFSHSSTYSEAEEDHKKAIEWVKNGCQHEGEMNE